MKDDDKLKEDKQQSNSSTENTDRDKPSNLQEGKDKETDPTEEDIETELKIHQAQTERD